MRGDPHIYEELVSSSNVLRPQFLLIVFRALPQVVDWSG